MKDTYQKKSKTNNLYLMKFKTLPMMINPHVKDTHQKKPKLIFWMINPHCQHRNPKSKKDLATLAPSLD